MNESPENVNQNEQTQPPEYQSLLYFRSMIRNRYTENESDRTPIYLVQDVCYQTINRMSKYQYDKHRIFTFDKIIPQMIEDQNSDQPDFAKGLKHQNEQKKPDVLSPVIIFYNDYKDKRIETARNILEDANIPVFLQDESKAISIIKETSVEAVKKEINRQYSETCSGKSKRKEFEQGFEALRKNRAISTGFPILDSYLDGGFYSGLYAIGGGTGTGKTTLLLNIADHIARSGHHVLMVALEMSQNELFAKMISSICYDQVSRSGIKALQYAQTTRDILKGGKEDESKEARYFRESSIDVYFDKVANNLDVHESIGNCTVKDIENLIKNHIYHTGERPVVIVDYLQILSHEDKYIRSNDKVKTDSNVLALKQLSRDYDIPILMISSLNRESYKDITQEVNLTSFKESGAIEYSCDVVLGLQLSAVTDISNAKRNKEKELINDLESSFDEKLRSIPRLMDIKLLKNRHGANNGAVRYAYYPNYNFYREINSVIFGKTFEQIERENKRSLTSFDN